MRIDISGASAVIRNQDILTVGMVGAKAEFRFGEEWDGLSKIAVFRQAGVIKDRVLASSVADIPWEVLHSPGLPVSIGVYGTNSDGTVVIPTIWVDTRPLRPGADPSGDVSADPTLAVWKQILAQVAELRETVNENEANSAPPVVAKSSGDSITVSDSANRAFQSFNIYGKTTQDGTPTPDSPVELVSVGNAGSITVTVAGKSETKSTAIPTPNGLPGIPVTSGGNYTDSNGQEWICDEIDLGRGVYIQRVGRKVFDGTENWVVSPYQTDETSIRYDYQANGTPAQLLNNCISAHFPHNGIRLNGMWVNGDQHKYAEFRIKWDYPDVDELKNFLSEQYSIGNPVTCLYTLYAPVETQIPDEVLTAYESMSTYRDQTTISNDASAYMELEYVMDYKKYIDSIIAGPAAKLSEVFLPASAWKGSSSLYSQVVSLEGITEYSKVDLLPSVEQLAIFHNKDVAFVTENEDGVVTVYAIGDKPTQDYTIQVGITEVKV